MKNVYCTLLLLSCLPVIGMKQKKKRKTFFSPFSNTNIVQIPEKNLAPYPEKVKNNILLRQDEHQWLTHLRYPLDLKSQKARENKLITIQKKRKKTAPAELFAEHEQWIKKVKQCAEKLKPQ